MNTKELKTMPLSEIRYTSTFLDPAGGKQQVKKTRAKSAIVVVGADYMNRMFVLHTWADRCPTSEIYRKIYEINEQFKPDVFGIESSAQQSLFVDGVQIDAMMNQKNIPIVPVPMPVSISKEFRIRTIVQPVVKDGRLFMVKADHKELFNQIRDHPMSAVKDLIDALASAIHLIPKQPLQREIDRENEALLEYLRNTGAPPHIIESAANGTPLPPSHANEFYPK